MGIRIMIADDHRITRDGLRSLLGRYTWTEVVGEAVDGADVLVKTGECEPDIVIMDLGMPGLTGVEATRRLVVEHPQCKVIVLSMYTERRFVLESLKAGARGFVPKISAFEELMLAIEEVMAGNLYLSPKITGTVLAEFLQLLQQGVESDFPGLTSREREILQLIAEGKTNRQISELLNISPKTVDSHRQQLMNKLNIHTVADLVKYALKEGIVLMP